MGSRSRTATGTALLLQLLMLTQRARVCCQSTQVNQVQGMYVEDSDISGAADNAIDFVAVQYGHICRTRIHKANWCVYAKGGQARAAACEHLRSCSELRSPAHAPI